MVVAIEPDRLQLLLSLCLDERAPRRRDLLIQLDLLLSKSRDVRRQARGFGVERGNLGKAHTVDQMLQSVDFGLKFLRALLGGVEDGQRSLRLRNVGGAGGRCAGYRILRAREGLCRGGPPTAVPPSKVRLPLRIGVPARRNRRCHAQ